jgi:hypothetical protein
MSYLLNLAGFCLNYEQLSHDSDITILFMLEDGVDVTIDVWV